MMRKIAAKAMAGFDAGASERALDQSGAYSADPWIRFGGWTLAVLAAAFVLMSWGFTINGAILASGVVGVKGSYQTVQNSERAIVQKILVKNGDLVQRGQLLIALDGTDARAALHITQAKLTTLKLQRARLIAERDGAAELVLPPALQALMAPRAITATRAAKNKALVPPSSQRAPAVPLASQRSILVELASQRALFKSRVSALDGQRQVLTRQIEQQQNLTTGLYAQLKARRTEADLAERRLGGIQNLYAKGYANTQQLTSAQQEGARLRAELGRLQAETGRSSAALAEARLRLTQLGKTNEKDIVEELSSLEAQQSELEQALKSQTARLMRVQLRSPIAGYVHDLAAHTIGGVLPAATAVLQIIPSARKLVINARIKPFDIDKLAVGQTATVKFPAFNAKRTPTLEGIVTALSPAQIDDPRTGPYFSMQIELPPSQLARIGKAHRLVPGLPADIFIKTRSRSIMSYFLKPLRDAMSFALREG